MRYFIKRSAIWDNPSRDYNPTLMAELVSQCGGLFIVTETAYGWDNQPEVVTFEIDDFETKGDPVKIKKKLELMAEYIKQHHPDLPLLGSLYTPLIYEKDW